MLSLIPNKYRLTVVVTGFLLLVLGLSGVGVTIYIKSLKSKLYGQIYIQFEEQIKVLTDEKEKLISQAAMLENEAHAASKERQEAENEIIFKTNIVAQISNFNGLLDFARNLP